MANNASVITNAGAGQLVMNEEYRYELASNYLMPSDIRKDMNLLRLYNKKFFLIDIIREFAKYEQTPHGLRQYAFWYEKMYKMYTTLASAVTAGAADATKTITVASTDYDSSNHMRLQARDQVYNDIADEVYIVLSTDPTNHQAVIKPQAGKAISAMSAGQILIHMPNGNPIGSNSVKNTKKEYDKIANQTQIIKTFKAGTWNITQADYRFQIPNGNGQLGIITKDLVDGEFEHRAKIDAALLLGKQGSYDLSSIATGDYSEGTAFTTDGTIPQIEAYGNSMLYNDSEIGLDFLNKINNITTDNQAGTTNFMFRGLSMAQKWTSWMLDQFKNGGIDFGAFGGSKEKAIMLGFDSIVVDNFTWHLKNLDFFNNSFWMNVNGNFGTRAFTMPDLSQSESVYMSEGGTRSENRPPLSIMYVPDARGNWIAFGKFSGTRGPNGDTKILDDATYGEYISEIGAELHCPEKCISIKRS